MPKRKKKGDSKVEYLFAVNQRLQNQLFDLSEFDVTWVGGSPIYFPRYFTRKQEEYLRASQVTLLLGNKSVDNTLKHWMSDPKKLPEESIGIQNLISKMLLIVKKQLNNYEKQFSTDQIKTESNGLFLSKVSIMRLTATFRAVFTMIQAGSFFEAIGLMRIILEQLAFAFSTSKVTNQNEKISSPTKAIGELKKFVLYAGELYGHLSKYTHYSEKEMSNYFYFNEKTDDAHIVYTSRHHSLSVCLDLLLIMDVYSCVSEYCFHHYLTTLNVIQKSNQTLKPTRKRKMISAYRKYQKIIPQYLVGWKVPISNCVR